jgi:hypothetical protein
MASPYRTNYPWMSSEETEEGSPLRWIVGRHTLVVWKVEVETVSGSPAIKIYLTTSARNSPSVWLHVPYSVDALVDLSKLVGKGHVDVTFSEGTETWRT